MKYFTLAIALSVLNGCAWTFEGSRVNADQVAKLKVGETEMLEAYSLLGKPNGTSDSGDWIYHRERLFYLAWWPLPIMTIWRIENNRLRLTWAGDVLDAFEWDEVLWHKPPALTEAQVQAGHVIYDAQGRRIRSN